MVNIYYKIFVIIILVIIIIVFSQINNKTELFNISKIKLHVNDDHEFINIFKKN